MLATRIGAAGHDLDEPQVVPSPPASAPSGEPVGGAELVASAEPVRGDAVWERLARCESSGDWDIATGNGYFGGLQFDDPTWSASGDWLAWEESGSFGADGPGQGIWIGRVGTQGVTDCGTYPATFQRVLAAATDPDWGPTPL